MYKNFNIISYFICI